MTEKFIVVVRDRQDEKHGEISVLDDPEKAERLVEALLEAGFERERIQVFSGQASEFQVSHRPVVALQNGDEATLEIPQAAPEDVATHEPAATAADEPALEEGAETPEPQQEPADSHPPVFKRDDEAAAEQPEQQPAEAEADEPEEEAEEAEPVRFSSLFRSA